MEFLARWSGESADALFALEATHRVDSLVLAFEQALWQKADALGLVALSEPERDVLCVEALEREVNNGGFSQLFLNLDSAIIAGCVAALERIGCPKTAAITATAIAARDGTSESERAAAWSACDAAFFTGDEDIAGRLFAYLKRNRAALALP